MNANKKLEDMTFYPSGSQNKDAKPISGKQIAKVAAKTAVGLGAAYLVLSKAEAMETSATPVKDFIEAAATMAGAGLVISKKIRTFARVAGMELLERAQFACAKVGEGDTRFKHNFTKAFDAKKDTEATNSQANLLFRTKTSGRA